MKRFKVAILLVGLVIFTFCAGETMAQDVKTVFVNPRRVVNEYQKAKDFESVFEVELKKGQERLDQLKEELKTLRDKLGLASDQARAGLEEQTHKKIQEIQEYERKTRDELVQQRDTQMAEIIGELNKAIHQYGEEKKDLLILDGRMVLFADERLDISEEIIKILNSNYSANKGSQQ